MVPQTQSLPSIQPDLEDLEEQQSAFSLLLPNGHTGAEELLEQADRNARSNTELPSELNSTQEHPYGVTELDDVKDVTRVGRCDDEIQTAESDFSTALMTDTPFGTRTPSLSLRSPALLHAGSSLNSHSSILNDENVLYARKEFLSPWFPQVDPQNPMARTLRTWRSGQKVLLTTATIASVFVLLLNIIIAIIMQSKYKPTGGVVSLYEGSCSWVKNVDTGFHLLINALSTLLLGASNLCMQLLAAPTREEVDKAHSKKRWLDIGVPSWRNLKSISRTRRLIWCILGVSSIPLHFIYNSVISSSLASYSYTLAVVNEKFLHGNLTDTEGPQITSSCQHCSPWPNLNDWDPSTSLFDMQNVALNGQTLVNRSKIDCLEVYTDMYGDRTNLLMVTQDTSNTEAPTILQYSYVAATWEEAGIYAPCDDGSPEGSSNLAGGPDCGKAALATTYNLERWTKFGRPVMYCLSEQPTGDHCRLNYSTVIMTAICIVSTFKCLCIAFTASWLYKRQEEPLCTLGDAISSFLERPDKYTIGLGIANRDSFQDQNMWDAAAARPIQWRPHRLRWYASASKRRWIFTMSICALAVVMASASLGSGSHGTMKRIRTGSFLTVLRLGFGTANPNAFTAYFLPKYARLPCHLSTGAKGFIANVLWANYWQIVVSFLYLAYNALLTCQLVSAEWGGYATERKTLRVSHPKGIQRSSYFISMQMKYGIPLLGANAIMHWLISQSVFVVSTTAFFPGNIEDNLESFTTTGYSTSAALASICFGIFMLIIIGVNAMRYLPEGMPLVSSCSAAISAACHRPAADAEAHLLPVQWGVIPSTASESAHCAFTTYRFVRAPNEGEACLGLPDKPQAKVLRPPGKMEVPVSQQLARTTQAEVPQIALNEALVSSVFGRSNADTNDVDSGT